MFLRVTCGGKNYFKKSMKMHIHITNSYLWEGDGIKKNNAIRVI